MKRSEALSLIDKIYGDFVKDWVNLDIGDEEALKNFVPLQERILAGLERVGVKPPSCGYIPTLPLKQNVLVNRNKHLDSLRWENEDFELSKSTGLINLTEPLKPGDSLTARAEPKLELHADGVKEVK